MTKQGTTKELFWRKVLSRCEQSGLSQLEFCKREKLNPNSLAYWKREIALRDAKRTSSKRHRQKNNSNRLSEWRSIIAAFSTSGLSRDEFCAREKLKPAAFRWWYSEVKRRDGEKCTTAPGQLQTFMPLTVQPEFKSRPSSASPSAVAEIDILAGTVRVFESVGMETLITLFKALKESSHDR